MKNWWWESDAKITMDLLDSVNTAICDFCMYLDAECLTDYSNVIM